MQAPTLTAPPHAPVLTDLELVPFAVGDDPTAQARLALPLSAETRSPNTLVYLEVDPGKRIPLHTHNADEVFVVLQGSGVVTAGGLFFIGATDFDRKFRAFDKRNGELLWETTLPAAGNATPATYEADGRQFVVIGAGGGKWGAASGGSYVAFALPRPRTGQ